MAEAAMDGTALAGMDEALAAHVASGDISGLVTLVAQGDAVHVTA